MFGRYAIALFLCALPLATARNNAPVACISSGLLTTLLGGTTGLGTKLVQQVNIGSGLNNNRSSCDATCLGLTLTGLTSTTVAQTALFTNNGVCYCGGSLSLLASEVGQTDVNGKCVGTTSVDYINSNLFFQGCVDTGTLSLSSQSGATVASPLQCLTSCSSSQGAIASVISAANVVTGFTCYCTANAGAGIGANIQKTACGTAGTSFLYGTTNPNNPNYITRRGALMADKKRRAAALCPKGMSACKIPGTTSFECVDTADELESCGGCVAGSFPLRNQESVVSGFNCLSIPGIARGGVSCSKGTCDISACRRGWTLQDGACVPGLTVQKAKARR